MTLKPVVKRIDIRSSVKAERHSALIANHEYAFARPVEGSNRWYDSGQEMELTPMAHVGALRRFAIDNSIAIKKDKLHVLE